MSNNETVTLPWVSVVFVQGVDYDALMNATENAHNTVQAAVEYLSDWDFGAETDANYFANYPQIEGLADMEPWGAYDLAYEHTNGYGLTYTYAVNHALGYASLNRRALSQNN